MEIELVKWMIRRDYKVKYYLDKLPAGYNLYPLKDKNNNAEIHYTSGIPLGYYVTNEDGSETFYIYNHLTLNVKVHYEKNLDKYTIVGFDVIPVSINNQIAGYMVNNGVIVDKSLEGKQAGIISQQAGSSSTIKDLSSEEGKGNNNVRTQESKARNDDGKRLLISEGDFLKADAKSHNNTEAGVFIGKEESDSKNTKIANGTEGASEDNKEKNKDGNKSASGSEKLLCKLISCLNEKEKKQYIFCWFSFMIHFFIQ